MVSIVTSTIIGENSGSGGGGGGPGGNAATSFALEAANFAALPTASGYTGQVALVLNSTGVYGFRKLAGVYRSNGSSWIWETGIPTDDDTALKASQGSILLGRYSASPGSLQEITISTGLNLNSSTGELSATGTSPGGANNSLQYNNSGAFGGFGSWDGSLLTIPGQVQSTEFIADDGAGTLAVYSPSELSIDNGSITIGNNTGSQAWIYVPDGSASFAAGNFTVDGSGNTNIPSAHFTMGVNGAAIASTYQQPFVVLNSVINGAGDYNVAFFGLDDISNPLGVSITVDASSGFTSFQGTVIGQSAADLSFNFEGGNTLFGSGSVINFDGSASFATGLSTIDTGGNVVATSFSGDGTNVTNVTSALANNLLGGDISTGNDGVGDAFFNTVLSSYFFQFNGVTDASISSLGVGTFNGGIAIPGGFYFDASGYVSAATLSAGNGVTYSATANHDLINDWTNGIASIQALNRQLIDTDGSTVVTSWGQGDGSFHINGSLDLGVGQVTFDAGAGIWNFGASEVDIGGQLVISGPVIDHTLSFGSAGQILTSTGTQVEWKSSSAINLTSVVTKGDLTARTTAQSSVMTSYTTPNDATTHTFRANAYTAITAISAGTLTVQVSFTDENNTARTISYFPMGLTSAGLTTTGFDSFPPAVIRCKPNTAITLLTTFTGVSITYDVGGFVELIY